MNRSAQQLGRLAKGKPKTLTKAERNRRAMSLAVARAKRWPNKSNTARCVLTGLGYGIGIWLAMLAMGILKAKV